MKIVLFILCIVFSAQSLACFSSPPVYFTDVDELIERTGNITLAHVVEAKYVEAEYNVVYTFKIDKVIKGQVAEYFKVDGYPLIWEGGLNTFDNHSESVFWDSGAGRLDHHPDCLIHPSFSVGGTYLLFLDQPYHNKSFEQIIRTSGDEDTKDKWLQYVERKTTLKTDNET